MFSPPNDTNLNNFYCELFAVQYLVRVAFALPMLFAVLQNAAIWRMKMKELNRGLFSEKVTSVATPFSL